MITRKSVKKKPVASSIEIVAPGVKLNIWLNSVRYSLRVVAKMAHLQRGNKWGILGFATIRISR